MTRTEIERITKLETEIEHMGRDIAAMATKVDQMHGVLMQAKGAQWAVLGMAGLMGFLASKASDVATWIGALPR